MLPHVHSKFLALRHLSCSVLNFCLNQTKIPKEAFLNSPHPSPVPWGFDLEDVIKAYLTHTSCIRLCTKSSCCCYPLYDIFGRRVLVEWNPLTFTGIRSRWTPSSLDKIPFCLMGPRRAQIPEFPIDQMVGLFRRCSALYNPHLSFSSPKHFICWMPKDFLEKWGISVEEVAPHPTTAPPQLWLFLGVWVLLLTTCGINEGSNSSVTPGQRMAPCQSTTAYGLLVDSSSSKNSEHCVWGDDSSSLLFPKWLSPNTSACWLHMFPYWLL